MSKPRRAHALVIPLLRVSWAPGKQPPRWWHEEPAVYELTKPNDFQTVVDRLRSKSTPPLRTVSVARAPPVVVPAPEPQSSSQLGLTPSAYFPPHPRKSSSSSTRQLPPSAYIIPHLRTSLSVKYISGVHGVFFVDSLDHSADEYG
ncbi:hypothetical protein BKA63DRAFT_565596 [Paraphoma chrysanthemicola]|nr:hypothetical protein BKA63DRAFT_565596 [Paraphoma chrysanthemicola]